MSAIMARPGDLALAQLCARLYATTAPGDWRRIWLPEDDDGVCVALAHIGDWDVVVDRGSTTLQDWLRDFQALPHAIIDHPLWSLLGGLAKNFENHNRVVVDPIDDPPTLFLILYSQLMAARTNNRHWSRVRQR